MKFVVPGLILLMACPLSAVQQAADEEQVRDLAGRLEDDDPVERESAQKRLLKMGKGIAPILKNLVKDAPPETVSRIRYILHRYKRDESLAQSLPPYRSVTIEHGTHNAKEILEEVTRQTGLEIKTTGLESAREINAGWNEVPALKVLDDICRAMGVGCVKASKLAVDYSHLRHAWRLNRASDKSLLEIDFTEEPVAAVSHWQQFRSVVKDVVITKTCAYEGASLKAHLVTEVTSQPGLKPLYVGNLEIVEVLDDRGTSLRMDPEQERHYFGKAPPPPGEDQETVWLERYRSDIDTELAIMPPPETARRLGKLRLKLLVVFALKEVNQTFKVEELKRTSVINLGSAKIRLNHVEVMDGKFSFDCVREGTFRGSPGFVMLNAKGDKIRTRGASYSSGSKTFKAEFTLANDREQIDSLRLQAWTGHYAFEVPFEFEDIPLPGRE